MGPWRPLRRALAACLALTLGSCSSWRQVQRYDSWTLYELPSNPIHAGTWERAFNPAMTSVESILGPFKTPVAVHAWHGSVGIDGPRRTVVLDAAETGTQEVRGIGPARIQAWHSRGGNLGSDGGIFIAAPETSTALHELVHAHFSEREIELPLWFEEGVATLLGDGCMYDGEWYLDGLAHWPMRELREDTPRAGELRDLLDVSSGAATSMESNVLVHFVGWAIVFDLYQETGELDWKLWYERFDWNAPLADASRRMARTLDSKTLALWLERLKSPVPGRRFAAACGAWKTRQGNTTQLMLDALEVETDTDVRVALALNLLASTEAQPGYTKEWRRRRRLIIETFREVSLPEPDENDAIKVILATFLGSRNQDYNQSLAALSRFWSE